MKNLFLTLAYLTIATSLFAQNAYYDALLTGSLKVAEIKDIKINCKCGLTGGENLVLDDLVGFLDSPFSYSAVPDFTRVRSILQKVKANSLAAAGGEAFAGTQLISMLIPMAGLSGLSTVPLDTALYGLTVYFADEFKRGYTETYLRGFNRSIGQVGEMQVLFPKTFAKLKAFDPIRYKEIGNELKSVFNDDLSASIDHLITHVDTVEANLPNGPKYWFLKPEICEKIRSQPSFKYLKISAQVGQKLINGVHPSDILNFLDDTYYKETPSTLMSSGLLTTSISATLTGSPSIDLTEAAIGTASGSLTITGAGISLAAVTPTTLSATGSLTITAGSSRTITSATTALPVTLAANNSAMISGMVVVTGGDVLFTTTKATSILSTSAISVTTTGGFTVESTTSIPTNLTILGSISKQLLSGIATITETTTANTSMTYVLDKPSTLPVSETYITGSTMGKLQVALVDYTEVDPINDFGNAIHFYNILQRNLRDTSALNNDDKANAWINFEKLSKLKSVAEKGYFLALLYHEDKDFFSRSAQQYLSTSINSLTAISFSGGTQSCTVCNSAFSTLKSKQIANLLSTLTKLDEYVRVKKLSLSDEQNFLPFMNLTGELVKLGFSSFTGNSQTLQRVQLYASLAENVYQVYNAVRVRNYSNIPLHVSSILRQIEQDAHINNTISQSTLFQNAFSRALTNSRTSEIFTKDNNSVFHRWQLYRRMKGELNDFERSTITRSTKKTLKGLTEQYWSKPQEFIAKIGSSSLDKVEFTPILSDLVRRIDYWSGFTSGVISATSSAEVNDVIRKFAAPPSSFIDKRTNPFTITVSGMPGLFVGREEFDLNSRLSVPKSGTSAVGQSATPVNTSAVSSTLIDRGYKTTIGLSLPIGFDFSWRLGGRDKSQSSWSLGLFAQVIDLGAMLNYRLNTQANSLPDAVTLRSLLSPGLTLNAGLPNSPLTIGFGYQYTAALRHISKEEHDESTDNLLNAHRWQFRLAYDIPLFRIFGPRGGQ